MDANELKGRLRLSSAHADDPEQLELLLELAAAYRTQGVLSGSPLPALHRVCASASDCWRGVPTHDRPSGTGQFDTASEKGCIVLPWVGPRYRRGGTVI